MSLKLKSVNFESGVVNININNDVCNLETQGFPKQDVTEAATVVMTMLKNIGFKNINITNATSSPAKPAKAVATFNDRSIDLIRENKTFEIRDISFQTQLIHTHTNTNAGPINLFTIDVYALDFNLGNFKGKAKDDGIASLMSRIKSLYQLSELYLIQYYQDGTDACFSFALYNNAQYVIKNTTPANLGRKKINTNMTFDNDKQMTFRADMGGQSWTFSSAVALIDQDVDLNKVVFIHPVLPIFIINI